ncbi:MAG: hypothetical protein KGL39_45650 [Patescibacteria group bacterium]|nr:hypothetical protein [Patescibacteria group bacterium]
MISSEWRVVAVNNTGVALGASDSISVAGNVVTSSTSGTLTIPSTYSTLLSGGASLANGATLTGTSQNTTPGTSVVVSGDLHAEATVSTATPSGTIDFYLQFYDTIAAAWPTAGASGVYVGSLYFSATGTQEADFPLSL